ncbi:MAG: SDR family oxidoreductase [Deltaproteobacteria bacterium]|nr:SDR family oxidoreductase [Deltaproteobacteria bacterium]
MKDIFGLEGEIAVVTGALGKLGPIWIEALLGAGAAVFALDLAGSMVSEDFAKLQVCHDETRLKLDRTDVRDRRSLEAVCQNCIAAFGTPTILVNNAGIDRPPINSAKGYRLEDIPLEENREILEVNTLGLFLVTQVFGSRMVGAGRGSIINIGSLYASVSPDARFYDHIQGETPFLKPPAYGASKAAVVNLTRYLATLWAPHGVRVNALSPGGVLGGQDEEFKRKFCNRVPLGRMATAEDLRGPLLFLASQASAYVTGTELVVDGGFTAW